MAIIGNNDETVFDTEVAATSGVVNVAEFPAPGVYDHIFKTAWVYCDPTAASSVFILAYDDNGTPVGTPGTLLIAAGKAFTGAESAGWFSVDVTPSQIPVPFSGFIHVGLHFTDADVIIRSIGALSYQRVVAPFSYPDPFGTPDSFPDTMYPAYFETQARAAVPPTPPAEPYIKVAHSVQPTTTYLTYADTDAFLQAEDPQGVLDVGYHYARVPIRAPGSGIALRLEQNGPSDDTRIYLVGATLLPAPGDIPL